MSGPKVVRIVTREEIQTICRGLMRAFDLEATELLQQAKRHGLVNVALEMDLSIRRERLTELFNGDQWLDFQKLAPAMTDYLTAEKKRIRAQALAAAEVARSKRRHLADSARSLVMRLESGGRPVADVLRNIAQKALQADDEQLASMEAIVGRELRQGIEREGSRLSAEAEALAQRLGAGGKDQTFAEWRAGQPNPKADAASARLDALLAEIETDEDPEVVHGFIARAAEILGETSEQRRALLTDSLFLDAAECAQRRREQEDKLGQLRAIGAALEGLATVAARTLAGRIAKSVQARETSGAEQLIAEGRALCDSETRDLAAIARRRAILSGLASLGYEVREGMTTSWVRDGRIVLRKPGTPDYGVELGAPADAARLQIRLVGSDRPLTPRSPRRDQDQETIWCSQFGELQDLIAKSSGELIIERAQPVGAVAVKTVAMGASEGEVRDIDRPIGARTVQ